MISNTHRNGALGLFIGGATLIISAVSALFKLLTRPQFLVDLYHALHDALAHRATPNDQLAIAQVVAACIAIVGALCLAFLLTYYGRPYNVPADQPSDAVAPDKAKPPA